MVSVRKNKGRVISLTETGDECLGTGSTWNHGCETWAEATLYRKPAGDLELILEHFGTTSRDSSFRRTLFGDAAGVLTGVINLYDKVPGFVEDALESLGGSEELMASVTGHPEAEHERFARIFRGLSPGHRRAVMVLVEALSRIVDSP